MDQPDDNLFVLGEVGSGRPSLLQQLMQEVAASKSVPSDLCYLLADEVVWEKLRRFSRTGRLLIEEPMQIFAPMTNVSRAPQALDLNAKARTHGRANIQANGYAVCLWRRVRWRTLFCSLFLQNDKAIAQVMAWHTNARTCQNPVI